MLVIYKHLWVRPGGSSVGFSEEILCFGKNCRKRPGLGLLFGVAPDRIGNAVTLPSILEKGFNIGGN